MTSRDASRATARDRSNGAQAPSRPRRSIEQIIEGVRRQRQHIMLLDGADPLRGGVAD